MTTASGVEDRCPCGQPLHYATLRARRAVEKIIAEMGPVIRITTDRGAWLVPRHYIALHGLASPDVPALAARYGWDVAR